ncbi:hypothetical protein BAE44_0021955 [Dichanthelium oligosanthes]|uniref:Uncharacterized protein n=1 Tax=Dichanthelium oligosanthes TaxID=888268 RepID=A0A1E5UVV9_9POAL|nr:hypothetical protein BAE44_0021955 [Dichanthelium oligosanthes]
MIFDTKTSALAVLPDLPNSLRNGNAVVAVAAGNRLYVIENGLSLEFNQFIDDEYCCIGGLHCLRLEEEDTGGGGEDKKASGSNKDWWACTENGRWTRHGDWELPFVGQAHHDRGLRAWVGLHGDERFRPDGYLCSCDVPHLGRRAEPSWDLGEEKLFLEHPERHIDAKLVYMGGSGRFCLVEILTR